MSSISSMNNSTNNSNRITGMATGMDIDQMVKGMVAKEQVKIDSEWQKQQVSEWKQEKYREAIKSVKGLYDKYFSVGSKDSIMLSKVYASKNIISSNSAVISANAGLGASNVNYNIKVDKIAKAAQLESNKSMLSKDSSLVDLGLANTKIKINNVEIDLKYSKTIGDVIETINDSFPKKEVIASFSEMSGKFTIKTNDTGRTSELTFEGELFQKLGMKDADDNLVGVNGRVNGSNNYIKVFDEEGKELRTIENESNIFTIDDITYKVNSVSLENISIKSESDTSSTVKKMKEFINEYSETVDNIYDLITEKKNREYKPLTEAQKDEMSEDEIKKWEDKAKKGILRNDREMRGFMEEIKSSISGVIKSTGLTLSDIGIKPNSDYNKQGQLTLDEEEFSKALEEKGEDLFNTVTEAFSNIRNVTYSYAGSSSGIFSKKAGMNNSSTEVNNLYSNEIRKQEIYIKELKRKMEEKEDKLYKKFAALESNMNKINAQISYLMGS